MLRVAAVARRAAEHLVLAALAEFAEIGERAVRRRHAGIVLLDAPAHLRDQLLLQRRGVAEQALGVVVLGFEIVADIRRPGSRDRAAPPAIWRPSARHSRRVTVMPWVVKVCGRRGATGGEGFLLAMCHSVLIGRSRLCAGFTATSSREDPGQGEQPGTLALYRVASRRIARCAAAVQVAQGCCCRPCMVRLFAPPGKA